MKAKLANDRGISTIKTSAFNYDGVDRTQIDLDEARDILDYDVIVKPCYTDNGVKIPTINYLVDSREGNIIPSSGVGNRFVPYPNYKMFDMLTKDIIPAIPGLQLETVATLHGLGTGLITTSFGEDFSIKGDNSPNKFRLMFCNDNTGLSSMLIGLTAVRIVCMNTLAMASKEVRNDGFKIHHTETAEERVQEAMNTVYCKLQQISFFKNRMENVASKSVNSATVERVLNRIFPLNKYPTDRDIVSPGRTRAENARAAVLSNLETDDSFTEKNGWALFNAITHDIFTAKKDSKTTDRTERTYRSSVGNMSDTINKWFSIVEEEVGVRMVA